jgi:hypothetical protein
VALAAVFHGYPGEGKSSAMHTGQPFAGFRAKRSKLGTSYHAVPVGGHPWIRAICGSGPGLRSFGWVAVGVEITCVRCQQRLNEQALATAREVATAGPHA